MKVWTNIEDFKAKNAAITIGSFDGVHLGHIEVIKQLNAIAHDQDGESVVFTFSPYPAQVLRPQKPFVMLSTVPEKIKHFEKAGVDHLIIFPFSQAFARLSYNEFVSEYLIKKLNIKSLLLGYDNKIGKDRKGDYEELIKLSVKHNFNVVQQGKIMVNEEELSSTHIRSLLNEGKLFEASKLLGYPYLITGKVIHGQHLGNKLGFPTANILPAKHKFIPANGVYAITVLHNNAKYTGMMNIGLRPTINENTQKPVIEAHLFDFNGSLYDQEISISVIRKLRNEHKFESVDALRAQLKKDKTFAIETLKKEFGI